MMTPNKQKALQALLTHKTKSEAAQAAILAERQEEGSDLSEGGQNRTKEGMAV